VAKHKLLLDDIFEEIDFTLIAIHCSLEDYRLAYLINKDLSIKLKRREDIDYNYASAFYSIHEWEDKTQQVIWNLVSNKCRKEETLTNSGSLFETGNKNFITHNLIPEYKSADFFLKIVTENTMITYKKTLNAIQNIPQVITAYQVETDLLKSKNNLIFH